MLTEFDAWNIERYTVGVLFRTFLVIIRLVVLALLYSTQVKGVVVWLGVGGSTS